MIRDYYFKADGSFERFSDSFFNKYPVNRHTLSNGLTVFTQENHELPVASMYTLFRTGSRNERPGITGISHLFEHMMFNGSRKFGPGEFDHILESGGGYSNAYTSRDMTVYYEEFTPALLETVIDLESDRMGWLDLSANSLRSEREVVKEERRLRTEDSIFGRIEEELFAASFQCHPYRWPVIGWMSDIESISLKDCRRYFKDYYAPNNAMIILSGDINTNQAVELFHKYYSEIPDRKTPPPLTLAEPEQRGEKTVCYRKKSELQNFAVGYHVPAVGHGDMYILDVLQTILTEGHSSHLYKKLVREKGIALYIISNCTWRIDPGLFIFFMQMKPGHSAEKGEKALGEALRELLEKGVSESELERANNLLEADFVYGLQTNSGRAHRIILAETLLGNFEKLFDPVIQYNAVTASDIHRVVSQYLNKDNSTVVRLIPDV